MALAIVVVGALWAGLPVSTLALFGLVLACPLMMFFMMRGMHGAEHDQHSPERPQNDDGPSQPQPPDHRHHDSIR